MVTTTGVVKSTDDENKSPEETEEGLADANTVHATQDREANCTNEVTSNKEDETENWVKEKIHPKPNEEQKTRSSVYILHVLFQILKNLNEQHMEEMAIEAKIQGSSIPEVELVKA